ncbi:fimbria/pilus outer membrane usher protein [Kluyvera ascorbata]|uniref:fimbria/pilus outer membrane usher protein n=1 Tax=Kluyvera ascorbata TaxID=51288 RepID=UPI0035CCD7BF
MVIHDLSQRSRFELSLNQNIGDLGNLTLSGSIQDYRDSRNRDKQLQFGWGKIFNNGVALNLSVTKSRTLSYAYNYNDQYDYGSSASYSNIYKSQTTTALSLTFPLGREMNSPSVSVVANNTKGQGSSYQTSLSGNVGDDNPVSYGVNFSTDNTSHQNIWGGNLQTRLPYANVTGSASTSQQYWQGSMSLQGAAVVHRGGITLGPYVGDSFALIDAPGARGAKIVGGQGSKIDYFGYALAPSLTPYHYNTVALDPQGMNNKVELEDGHKRIAPYAGATVRVKFNTINGQAILITAKTLNNKIIPMGTSVLDSDGKEIGMVGQANQVYLRSVKQHAKITLKWGNQDNQKCNLEYDLPTNLDAPVALLDAQCR